ncbi:MAG TPA: sigma-70 family RNA polymerase sigma factor [Candidatus Acidoferrales bacterium]|nr:sigma-70 family RNA polymerase sigma factor [Candidatus Acidoferrales bacterium]
MPPKKGDREQLLIEAAQRDPARFVELYEENFERVYAFVSRRVHMRADAEDVTAEVFQTAFENLARFEWRKVPFVAWLYRIAANALADRWRKVSRESGKPAAEVASVEFDESEIEMAELRAQLFRSVANLPEDQRRVIEMRFAEEKSIREIAKELGRTTGAVKQLQFRAYQKLREQAHRNFRNRLGGRNG